MGLVSVAYGIAGVVAMLLFVGLGVAYTATNQNKKYKTKNSQRAKHGSSINASSKDTRAAFLREERAEEQGALQQSSPLRIPPAQTARIEAVSPTNDGKPTR